MAFVATPALRYGVATMAALAACPALADAPRRSLAVVETFTCANLSASNDADPAAMQQIGRAIAMVHNRGSLPTGAAKARVVLRLCFNKSLSQPILELVDYDGPVGEVATATQRAASRSVTRALNAGTLTDALGALAGGRPENAVVDLVFGPEADPDE